MAPTGYFDDRTLNREQRRALEKAQRAYIATLPEKLTRMDDNDPMMPYSSHPEDRIGVWRNKKFSVILWKVPAGEKMTISRNEWDSKTRRYEDGITWDEIQEIKRELGYGERTGVEFFPPDSELINIANVRHIWFLPDCVMDGVLKLV